MRVGRLIGIGLAAGAAFVAPFVAAAEGTGAGVRRAAELEASAHAGSADALYDLGLLYEYGGDGIAPDLARAMDYYRRAAALGQGGAVYSITDKQLDASSRWYDEAAALRLLRQQMNRDAANGHEYRRRLAAHLITTTTPAHDMAEAMRLLRDGVTAGDAYSMRDLAAALTPGEGDDDATHALRDPHVAIALYERFLALPEGRDATEDMAELARLYVDNAGDGVEGDAKASKWIEKAAADPFSALGQLYLGDFLFYGRAGRTYDFAAARQHWGKAAELRPNWNLADRFAMVDEAVAEDRTTTTPQAMVEIAQEYEHGYGRRPMDWGKARRWYQRAIDAGSTDRKAMEALASFYELDGSPSKAAMLNRKLATGNDEIATHARERLAKYDAAMSKSRIAEASQGAAKPVTSAAPAVAKAVPAPTSPGRATVGPAGSPTARHIRDALVYEAAYGTTTGADMLGLVQRKADYEAGVARIVSLGLTMDRSFAVANPTCTALGKGRFSCRYDLHMVTMGFPYTGTGSQQFERRDGIWRSPTFQNALIKGSQMSGRQPDPDRQCMVRGFGTAEGASYSDKNGLAC